MIRVNQTSKAARRDTDDVRRPYERSCTASLPSAASANTGTRFGPRRAISARGAETFRQCHVALRQRLISPQALRAGEGAQRRVRGFRVADVRGEVDVGLSSIVILLPGVTFTANDA